MKYYIDKGTQKFLLFMRFVVWNCNGCCIDLFTDYANNPIFQELPNEVDYYTQSDYK